MIIVDNKLKELHTLGKPIRVGLVGAGFIARGVAHQLLKYVKGIQLVGIAARTPSKAEKIIQEAGAQDAGVFLTDDPYELTKRDDIDVICEVTGSIEYATNVIIDALNNHKHVVTLNAEVDGTVGYELRNLAKENGVIYTGSDGDQPGVELNLYRYVKGLGLRPVLCGNIKGLHDPYRNPTTQQAFAKKWGQQPQMVASFADGTKISFEQCIVANATGMKVMKRGMAGPVMEAGTDVEKTVNVFDTETLLRSADGFVDYVVGAAPNGGIFILATTDDPIEKHYLNLYKVGEGPLYCFYNPYHLCHFEVPSSIARAAIFHDETISPRGAKPSVEVISAAKKDIKKGEKLDGFGGYCVYGLADNSEAAREEDLLPIGFAEGSIATRDIKKDELIARGDVNIPAGLKSYELWLKQFSLAIAIFIFKVIGIFESAPELIPV